MRKLLLPISIATLLSACGPIYSTDYVFTPPKSESGRFCTMQCGNSKQQCLDTEELRAQNCELRSEREQRDCEDDIYDRKGREAKWYECGSASCSVDEEKCESRYRSCYQSCGGDVSTETRCVSNCEQAARR